MSRAPSIGRDSNRLEWERDSKLVNAQCREGGGQFRGGQLVLAPSIDSVGDGA